MSGHTDFVYDSGQDAFVRAEAGASGDLEHMRATDRDFLEVPLDLCDKPDWRPVRRGRWTRPEHITLLEARTAVGAVQHRLLAPHVRNSRMLYLGDDLGCVRALSRACARDFKMPVQVQHVAAWLVARLVRGAFRWRASGTPPTTLADWPRDSP